MRIVVASDVRLFREGISVILSRDGRVAAAAATKQELFALEQVDSDILLIDVGMADAITAIRHVLERTPQIKVIVVGLSEKADVIEAYAEAGVVGYLSRDASVEDLVGAVECAARDEVACSPRVAARLLRQVRALGRRHSQADRIDRLTPREKEVVALIERGLSNKQIARRLRIKLSTTKNHVHNVLEKLQANRRSEAVARVRDAGILDWTGT